MFAIKTLLCLNVMIFCCLVGLRAEAEDHIGAASIGLGSYSAGHVGNYAGHLSAAKALSELQLEKEAAEAELHDFSEAAAEHSHSHFESLGGLGDHLQEQHFPVDYEAEHLHEHQAEATAVEYEEAATAATEHHGNYESIAKADQHHFESAHLNEIDSFDDFHSKPVPGIDHGKGAFSYSTTYEFKEPPHDALSHDI